MSVTKLRPALALNIGEVELTITGQLTDGTVFEAAEVIRVIDKGSRPAK